MFMLVKVKLGSGQKSLMKELNASTSEEIIKMRRAFNQKEINQPHYYLSVDLSPLQKSKGKKLNGSGKLIYGIPVHLKGGN